MTTYEISDDPSRLDIEVVHRYLSTEAYWSPGIPRAVVERAMDNSLCFGVYAPDGTQVGFGRAISDYATFAYVADVFILPEHRGRGLSKRLMEAMLGHPDLQGLRRWLLATRDAHGLYEQFGFTLPNVANRFMERTDPDVYKRQMS